MAWSDLGGCHQDREPGPSAEEERKRFFKAKTGMAAIRDEEIGLPTGYFAQSGVATIALCEVVIFEEKLEHQFYAVPHGWFVVAVQNPGRPVPPQEGNGLWFGALRSLFPLA